MTIYDLKHASGALIDSLVLQEFRHGISRIILNGSGALLHFHLYSVLLINEQQLYKTLLNNLPMIAAGGAFLAGAAGHTARSYCRRRFIGMPQLASIISLALIAPRKYFSIFTRIVSSPIHAVLKRTARAALR